MSQNDGAGARGDLRGPVLGAVVHDDDLAARVGLRYPLEHAAKAWSLVVGRNDQDRAFQPLSCHERPGLRQLIVR